MHHAISRSRSRLGSITMLAALSVSAPVTGPGLFDGGAGSNGRSDRAGSPGRAAPATGAVDRATVPIVPTSRAQTSGAVATSAPSTSSPTPDAAGPRPEAATVEGLDEPATIEGAARADRLAPPSPPPPPSVRLGTLTSPDVGEHCAAGLGADALTAFFAMPIGRFQGADYQRALRLPDDRVLWTFQDAFISGTLVHNAAMIQSGRCFTLLDAGARSWLFSGQSVHMRRWHWILDGAVSDDGSTFHLYVVQMDETGASYLSRTRPTLLRRVVLDSTTLTVRRVIEEPSTGDDLYGWSITNDARFTYLYSHCYQQFGFDTPLGFGECAVNIKVARVPRGRLGARLEYWDGDGWTGDHRRSVPVVDGAFVLSGNNPAQIRFDGERFVLIEKRDDWWGRTIEIGVADAPYGPFRHSMSIDEPLKCDRSLCNTYFAAWVPWVDEDGSLVWSIGHNRWDGSTTYLHLDTYRPTFHRLRLSRPAAVNPPTHHP